jgi:hypothetical protein
MAIAYEISTKKRRKQMKRMFTYLLSGVMALAGTASSQWVDQSSILRDTFTEYNTGLLAGGCVVAGVSLITALAISSPDPELSIQQPELTTRLPRLGSFGKPVKIGLGESTEYGIVDSYDAMTLNLRTIDGTKAVPTKEVDNVIDLASAAHRSRVAKTKWLICGAGVGLGIILVAASEESPKSSLVSSSDASIGKTLLYAAGGSLIVGGLIGLAVKSGDEVENDRWNPTEEREDDSRDEEHTSSMGIPRLEFSLMKLTTHYPSGNDAVELVPAVRASISLW